MFDRILVPLDGSSRAEQALPIAARMACKSGGSVLLLRVCTTLHNFARSGMESAMSSLEDMMKTERTEVNNYLARIATSEMLEGVGTVPIIAEGSPALHILTEAKDHEADVIVMCSHGDTGLKRWLLGSVAEKVIRHSPVPVLVLREGTEVLTDTSPEERHAMRILVPLDGSSLAEEALKPAAYLSAALSHPWPAELRLVQILPLIQWWRDTTKYAAQQDMDTEEYRGDVADAQAYLDGVALRLREGELASMPLQVSTRVALATDAAGMIVDTAEGHTLIENEYSGDIIAMATHGRSGFRRWLLGTTTERVLSGTHLPLFVIRPPHEAEQVDQKKPSGSQQEKTEHTSGWVGLL